MIAAMKVGAYLRISADPDGTQEATERQRTDLMKYAERAGLEIAGVYEDIDLSAYRRGVRRPAFEKMLEDLKGGEIAGVLTWKLDRLYRQPRDYVRLDDV